MGLSINVTDIFKLLLERNGNDRDKTIHYLEQIVDSAQKLAEVWFETYRILEKEPSVTIFPDRVMGWNFSPYHQLQEFYKSTSSVLGNQPEFRDSFIDGIAKLLMQREVTKEAYEKMVSCTNEGFFLDEKNSEISIEDLRLGVVALQREVAALEVLLEQFRAIGK